MSLLPRACGDITLNLLFVAEHYFGNPDLVRLSEELSLRNHNISVASSFDMRTPRATDRDSYLKRVHISEIKPLVTIYRVPYTVSFSLSKIYRIVREQNIHVIHAVNDHSTNVAQASLISTLTRLPLVYTIQGPGSRTGNPVVDVVIKTYELTVERFIARKARKVILLSRSLRSTAETLGVDDDRITVVPSGVDHNRFDPERPEVRRKAAVLADELDIADDIVIGYVGRVVRQKGLTYLFSAVKLLQSKHPNLALLIVGEGTHRKDLEAIAKSLKIKVIFAGYQHDAVPYYQLMDIFVLPSLFEGLPNVILEAMAMEKAIVATNVGGNPDVLSNGTNGFLVHVQDVQQLASALGKLIRDEDLRVQMGIANRREIKDTFSWSRTVGQVERIYNEVV